MQVNFSLTNLFRFVRVNSDNNGVTNTVPYTNASQQDITQRNLNDRRIGHIQATLGQLDELLARSGVRTSIGTARAISQAPMNLSNDATATTLDSAQEVNEATTSYTPFGPDFSGLTTTLPEIHGVYDGSVGNDTFRFRVSRSGVRGQSRIDIKVTDSNGDNVKNIKINEDDPLDQVYEIKYGLELTLGAGAAFKDDDFYLTISSDTPSSVNPDAAFNAIRNDRPDFDPGQAVTAGSFDINGVEITVAEDDSINSVLGKINASAASVDAVFDLAADRVRLTHRQAGSAHDIVISGDTSGFVAATKLTGLATPGTDREAEIALSATTRFASVTSGSLRINSNNIAFDIGTDSLTDIIDRINEADIGVLASLVNGGQKVSIRSTIPGMPLTLDDNDTGLFDAANLVEKQYKAKIRSGPPKHRTYAIANKIEESVRLINEVFDPLSNHTQDSPALAKLRGSLLSALRSSGPDGETAFGLQFQLQSPLRQNMIRVDRRSLTRYAQVDAASFTVGLAGFSSGVRGALAAYRAQFGGDEAGVFVNTVA